MSEENSQKNNFFSGAEVLQKLLQNDKSPLASSYLCWKISLRWEEYAGASLAEASRPQALIRGKLILKIKSSAWAHQLQFMKEDIRHRINVSLGVERIFEIGFFVESF